MTLADAFQALEADLLGPEPDYDTEPAELQLTDEKAVNRELRHINRIRRERAAYTEVAIAEQRRIQEALAIRIEMWSRAEAWHLARVQHFHEAILAFDPKAKTIPLPDGVLEARAQQPEWTFDREEFIAWALVNLPDAVRLAEPEVAKDAAKQLLTRRDEKGNVVAYGYDDNNERPPGVTVVERGLRFSVRTES